MLFKISKFPHLGHGRTNWSRVIGTVAGASLALSAMASAASAIELKIAHYVPAKHPVSIWLENWAKKLEKDTGGKLTFKVFPGSQMGPAPKYFDLTRRGQIDIGWFLHGFSPGVFPLTELSSLPYLFASSEAGTKTLNDPELRKYLDKEHKGVVPLLLMTHQPGDIHTARKAIRSVADVKGMRLRFASTQVKNLIVAMNGTPVGLPPTEIADAMQKGTLDGAFIDYGGAGIAFKMGPVTKYTTELYAFTASFCICMNERKFKSLPADLRAKVLASFKGVEKDVGHQWDKIDPVGKQIMMKAGMTPIRLSAEEDKKFRAIGAQVSTAQIAMLQKRGLPAQKVFDLMKKLADKNNATSRNFWTEK
ncbi:MAG: TRAP transporter substrate-binding protein [Hyphomicrobiales bacterium]|nr:TRAP transporter substrate-binding protein [Hyphomicrobiales bacterium]